MSITNYNSQIGRLEKEILDLEKKMYSEQKRVLDKEKQIATVNKSINKNASISMLKSKGDQILRYQKEILMLRSKIGDYERRKLKNSQDLRKKLEALKKEELAVQKRQQQALSRSLGNNPSRDLFTKRSENIAFEAEEHFMKEDDDHLELDATISVFVSYSWDSKGHEKDVFNFVNYLRINGFNAEMDKGLSQRETSTNFLKMMYKAMHNYPKVIVVLSNGYKEKADSFTGGVGTEYELMINDINDNPNKYILASFFGREDTIIPAGLKGRDIVDLSDEEEKIRLFEKLMGHERYVFAEVAKKKPELPVRVADDFAVTKQIKNIPLDIFLIAYTLKEGDISLSQGLFRAIDFTLKFGFTNQSEKTINGFNYNIRLPKELDLDNYYNADSDGFVHYEKSFDNKIFNNQRIHTDGFPIRITHQHVLRLIETEIKVEIFCDVGAVEKIFLVKDLIKIRPGNEHFKDAVPLSPELFTSR
jgi:hypothetical protein